jgi:hypothetical protein
MPEVSMVVNKQSRYIIAVLIEVEPPQTTAAGAGSSPL